MINVPSALQEIYIKEIPERRLYVTITGGDTPIVLTNEQIILESMELKEAISETDQLEFVGCISSQFKLQIVGVKQKLKNKTINVTISCKEGEIPLFNGTIYSDARTANRRVKEIIAYDDLYSLSGVDVTEWVNSRDFPMTVGDFRDEFFKHINIKQQHETLTIDGIIIPAPTLKKPVDLDEDIQITYLPENKTLTALDVIKSICQAAGVFGIINRYNRFEYRKLAKHTTDDGAYPGAELTTPFLPGTASESVVEDAQFYPSYRSLGLETYNVSNIKTVVVKQNDDSQTKGYINRGGNKYTVLGNLFTMYQELPNLERFAGAIADNIADVDFTPFDAECIGLPYLECGDAVQYYVYDFEASEKQKKDVYVIQTFFILSRTLTGILSTKDVFNASAEKRKQRVSDLGIRIDEDEVALGKIEKDVSEVKENNKELNNRLDNLEGKVWDVQSVATEPADPKPMTIYFIQGSAG